MMVPAAEHPTDSPVGQLDQQVVTVGQPVGIGDCHADVVERDARHFAPLFLDQHEALQRLLGAQRMERYKNLTVVLVYLGRTRRTIRLNKVFDLSNRLVLQHVRLVLFLKRGAHEVPDFAL